MNLKVIAKPKLKCYFKTCVLCFIHTSTKKVFTVKYSRNVERHTVKGEHLHHHSLPYTHFLGSNHC